MDITGSVAMGHGTSDRGDPVHEAFGHDYAQPNLYNETCANIGNGMFSWRMLSLSGDAKYADLMERVAYNCLNASVDLKGENWFYCNPLSWDGTAGKETPHRAALAHQQLLLLSAQCGPYHRQAAQLGLQHVGRRALGPSLRRQQAVDDSGRRFTDRTDAGNGLPVGRQGDQAHREQGRQQGVCDSLANSRVGRATPS